MVCRYCSSPSLSTSDRFQMPLPWRYNTRSSRSSHKTWNTKAHIVDRAADLNQKEEANMQTKRVSPGLCMWSCCRTGPAIQASPARPESGSECTGGRRVQWCCCYWDAKSGSGTSPPSFFLKAAGHFEVPLTARLNQHVKRLQWKSSTGKFFLHICIYVYAATSDSLRRCIAVSMCSLHFMVCSTTEKWGINLS